MTLTPQDIASVDPAYWAVFNEIKLQASIFTFADHEYQREPMNSKVRRKCYMKGTQGGWTEVEILDDFHGMRYSHYPLGVLHLMPTNDDVNEFSKARFNPLILANRLSIGRFVKKTDTASLKKIGDAFLYLRGARLSQKVAGEEKESSKLRSIPVDACKFDEMDLMDEDVISKARGRMGHSKVKKEVYISNPTIPDYGIDKIFQTSDQRHWFRKCSHCGDWTCAELSFPDCVKIRSDGTGYIGCNKCGKEVPLNNGEWVPSVPSNSDFMHGYRWSQLTSAFNDPAEILEDFANPPEGNLGDVYRLRLGLPYIASEDRLTEAEVLACCGNEINAYNHQGPCAMGVDVGKVKHIVIGVKMGKRFEIVKTTQLSEWNDIHDIAKRFNVKSAVIDIRPYEDSARQFQKAEKYKIWLCEYSETLPTGPAYNEKTGIVKVNRTEVFDSTHRLVSTDGMLRLPRLCPEVKEFAKQVCATAKVLETNKRTNTQIYRYRKLGEDHFRNALNYFYLAASGNKLASIKSAGHKRQLTAINEYDRLSV